jgi:hypothetical protein
MVCGIAIESETSQAVEEQDDDLLVVSTGNTGEGLLENLPCTG